MTQDRLPGLDALRGIAAVCVVVYHAFWSPVTRGYLAVDLFFMLSGYVMARTYEARLLGRSEFGPAAFLWQRWCRLWPIMSVGTLLGLALISTRVPLEPSVSAVLFLSLMFIPVLAGNDLFPLNPPSWSITYELLANAAHALVLAHLRTQYLVLIAAACVVPLYASIGIHDEMPGARPWTVGPGVFRIILSYTIGIILCRRWNDAPPKVMHWGWAVGVLPVILIAAPLAPWSRATFDVAFVLLVCPVLMVSSLQATRTPRFFAVLGALSFPLYAVHQPILLGVERWFGLHQAWGIVPAFVVAWVVMRVDADVRRRHRTSRKAADTRTAPALS